MDSFRLSISNVSLYTFLCILIFSILTAITVETLTAQTTIESESLEIVDTILLEKELASIAVNEKTNLIYVGVQQGLIIIDGQTNDVEREITLDDMMEQNKTIKVIAIDSQNNRIYVDTYGEILVLDGITHQIVGMIDELISNPYDIAINPFTNRIYIADESGWVDQYDRVAVYDGESLELITKVNMPGSKGHQYFESVGVAVNPNKNLIYATWSGDNALHVIDGCTHQIIETVSPIYDWKVRVNPITGYVYVWIKALDGETLEEIVSDWPGSLPLINPTYNWLFTTEGGPRGMYILNGTTHEIMASFKGDFDTPLLYYSFALNSETGKIYAAEGKKISVIQGPIYHISKFYVSDLTVEPERIMVGEPAEISIRVENIGNLPGSHMVVLRINCTEELRKEVELAEGQSTKVKFNLVKDVGGTYIIQAEELSSILTVSQFVVSELTIDPSEVESGEEARITVRITNLGETASSYVAILEIDGLKIPEEVNLSGSESKIIEFNVTQNISGEYIVKINDLQGKLIVKHPAEFIVSNLSIIPPTAKLGDEVEINIKLSNVGESKGSYEVILKVDNVRADTNNVELEVEESKTVTFVLSRNEEGSYEININGETAILTIQQLEPSPTQTATPTPTPTHEDSGVFLSNETLIAIVVGVVAICIVIVILLLKSRK